MSLRPETHQRIPARAVRRARAACPKGTPAMLIGDTDEAVAALGRTAERTRLLSAEQWHATGPQTSDQVNDFD